MKFYTNNKLKNVEERKGTATININENIQGKFSGEIIKKGSQVVVSGRQYDTLMDVIDDGNCEWDMIVDQDDMNRDQFTLSYTEDHTNFDIDSINC